jgi:hypothetical protein
MQPVISGFGQLVGGMQQFGKSLQQQASPENIQKLWGQLTETFSTVGGQIALITNNIALLQQNLTLVDTYRQQADILERIKDLQSELDSLTAPPVPVFSPTPAQDSVDPALQNQNSGGGNITVNAYFPDVRSMSTDQISELYAKLEQESARRGL